MAAGSNLPRVEVTSRSQLRAWLAEHHATSGSIWLVTWKKQRPDLHLPYDAIVEEALCFGWVDSLPRKLDAGRTMLLLSRRKPRSAWSAANKARVARLTTAGRMAPAGLAAVDTARADGSWAFLDDVERLEVPVDLAAAMVMYPEAAAHFAAFPRSVRRGILEWIKQARRPDTRAKRISETASLAAQNKRANQFR
ncbi:MAG: YdeI/OmpD-associated family protein [Paracoccaceae bacterium]|nr:MAG: YdeI/OmpD-associated family protein [Paracoccaceae bacterium]